MLAHSAGLGIPRGVDGDVGGAGGSVRLSYRCIMFMQARRLAANGPRATAVTTPVTLTISRPPHTPSGSAQTPAAVWHHTPRGHAHRHHPHQGPALPALVFALHHAPCIPYLATAILPTLVLATQSRFVVLTSGSDHSCIPRVYLPCCTIQEESYARVCVLTRGSFEAPNSALEASHCFSLGDSGQCAA